MNEVPALIHFDAARRALAEAHAVDEVKEIRDQAEALRAYYRQRDGSIEMANQCAEIKVRAERRLGELLAATPMFGQKDVSKAGHSKTGIEHFSYACQRHASYGTCEMKQAGGQAIDNIIRAELSRFVVTEDVRRQAEALLREQDQVRAEETNAQRRNLLRVRAQHERERDDLAESYLLRGKGVVSYEVYNRLEAEHLQAIGIIDRTLKTLDEVRPLDIAGELALLENARWDLVEKDDPLWRAAAVLLIERVTVRRGERKGQPRLEIRWAPAASLIRTAVEAAV